MLAKQRIQTDQRRRKTKKADEEEEKRILAAAEAAMEAEAGPEGAAEEVWRAARAHRVVRCAASTGHVLWGGFPSQGTPFGAGLCLCFVVFSARRRVPPPSPCTPAEFC